MSLLSFFFPDILHDTSRALLYQPISSANRGTYATPEDTLRNRESLWCRRHSLDIPPAFSALIRMQMMRPWAFSQEAYHLLSRRMHEHLGNAVPAEIIFV